MDVNNIAEANGLFQQWSNYRQALAIIDNNGTIASLTVIGGGIAATVAATDIVTPPQMMDSIRTQLQAKVNDLQQQLANLGMIVG